MINRVWGFGLILRFSFFVWLYFGSYKLQLVHTVANNSIFFFLSPLV